MFLTCMRKKMRKMRKMRKKMRKICKKMPKLRKKMRKMCKMRKKMRRMCKKMLKMRKKMRKMCKKMRKMRKKMRKSKIWFQLVLRLHATRKDSNKWDLQKFFVKCVNMWWSASRKKNIMIVNAGFIPMGK